MAKSGKRHNPTDILLTSLSPKSSHPPTEIYPTCRVPMRQTTTVYSREVIPNQAFSSNLNVKPVLGYYFFFKANLLDDDLKGKADAETLNKLCCFHNVGYLVFGTENEAVEALTGLEALKDLKWLTMRDCMAPNLDIVKQFITIVQGS